ncbi:MAG TPA: NUDIX domain-containing protein [Anaerolineaceae bacterium]|nr:NUDIX domain-containing protein [Anaerolineaceae bacterium]HPN50505.1 NUDIX domain-containing protein [Anaerolineaceae bacterium]
MEPVQRVRAAAIIIQEGKIALIKRIFPERTYYVFPGGGVEAGEDIPAAVRREVLEELGLAVEVGRLAATVRFRGQMQYFHLARVTGGTLGSGHGKENSGAKAATFQPVWVAMADLPALPVRPAALARYLLEAPAEERTAAAHFDEA